MNYYIYRGSPVEIFIILTQRPVRVSPIAHVIHQITPPPAATVSPSAFLTHSHEVTQMVPGNFSIPIHLYTAHTFEKSRALGFKDQVFHLSCNLMCLPQPLLGVSRK